MLQRCCELSTRIFLRLLPLFLLSILTFIGALIFHSIEEPLEIERARADGYDIATYETQWNYWASLCYVINAYTLVGECHISFQVNEFNQNKSKIQ